MTKAVDLGRKATKQTNKASPFDSNNVYNIRTTYLKVILGPVRGGGVRSAKQKCVLFFEHSLKGKIDRYFKTSAV